MTGIMTNRTGCWLVRKQREKRRLKGSNVCALDPFDDLSSISREAAWSKE